MNLEDFKNCVEFNIEHGIKHAILGLGAPGIGKSEAIKQIGDKYGYKVIDLRLAQMSEVEIGGLIYPNEDKTKTRWLTPEILPDEARDGKNTILLLDEITSCNKRVQVAAYQLILDRRIGEYTLPEGTYVIALGNREEDDGVYVELAAPLADRFEIHNIDVDFESWKNNYAIPNKLNRSVIQYLSFSPDSLHTQNKANGEMHFATPRSWSRVSEILNLCEDIKNPVIMNKIIGNIGTVEASKFAEFCRNIDDKVTAEEFLEGFPAPKSHDMIVNLVSSLVQKVSYIKSARTMSVLTDSQKETLNSVIKSLFRMPSGEYTIMGLRSLAGLNKEVVKKAFAELDAPEITQFIRKHNFA